MRERRIILYARKRSDERIVGNLSRFIHRQRERYVCESDVGCY